MKAGSATSPDVSASLAVRAQDGAVAVLLALAALAVYFRTLAPGLVPIIDTPVFQFVGRVLGTPHNPGYPAYLLVTHLWSYLPVGSLAYRMNLFSAVAGAVAVAGVYVFARQLGVRPPFAAFAAGGLAGGSIFWSQAIIAEVYTLNAATIIWMLAAMIGWGISRRRWQYFAAVALLSFGFGNHTTIVLFVPGLIAFALLADPRFALRPSTVVLTAVIVMLGVAQYALILVRSGSPGAYLESRASNFQELVDVMRGAQFENALFRFSVREVATERMALIGRFIASELTIPVLLLALAGAVMLLVRRPREGLLITTGGAAVFFFTLNYDAGDIHVFTIPTLVVLWLCAGVAACEALRRFEHRTIRVAVTAATCLFPVWQLARNFEARDLSREIAAVRAFDSLFSALPDRTILVRENFVLDRMLMYKLVGEQAAGARKLKAYHIKSGDAAALHESGWRVFAFPDTADRFRYEGVNVSFAPFRHGSTLDERIGDVEPGAIIGFAVPGTQAAEFSRATHAALQGLVETRVLSGHDQAATVVLAIKGDRARGRLRTDRRSRVSAEIERIRVTADAVSAAIGVGERDVIRSEDGVLMAIADGRGNLQTIVVLSSADGFRVRSPSGSYSIYEVDNRMPQQTVAPAWSPIEAGTGLVLLRLPANAEATVVSAGLGCDARVVDRMPASVEVRVEPLSPDDPDREALNRVANHDADAVLQRLQLSAGREATGVLIATGCPGRMTARGTTAGIGAYSLSAHGLLDVPGRVGDTVLMARTTQAWLLGAGWSAVTADAAGPFRWLAGDASSIMLPVRGTGARRLRLQGLANGIADGSTLRLKIDDGAFGDRPLVEGWNWYEWDVPGGSLDPGVHHLTIKRSTGRTSEGMRPYRFAVSQIELLGRRQW